MSVSSLILHKRNSISGVVPQVSALSAGEIAINTADGKLFTKTIGGSVKEFVSTDNFPYVLNTALSSVNYRYGNNTSTGILAGVLGGVDNDVSGAGSTVINGSDNDIAADYAFIGNGSNNKILANGDFGGIVGGQDNTLSHPDSFIIGSNISSHLSGFTYVNNLSATGYLYGDGSRLTGINANSTSTTTSIVSSNFVATTTVNYLVDTRSNSVTSTLPTTPSIGDTLYFQDCFLTWNTNNFTLNRNGNMIQGLNENFACDLKGVYFSMTFIGSTVGWRIN